MNRRESLSGKDQQAAASVADRHRLLGRSLEAAGIEPADARPCNAAGIEGCRPAHGAGCQAETQERNPGVGSTLAVAGAVAFALLTASGWTEVWVAELCLAIGGAP